jgi:hypothetical protein
VAHDDGQAIANCFQTHALEMLAVGVPLATLASMTGCTARDYVQRAPPAVVLTLPPSPPPELLVVSGAQPAATCRALAAAAAAALVAICAGAL